VLAALVGRAQQGDEEAFAALTQAVGDRCMAIAYRILRDVDQADDAVQQTLIVAWRELRTLRDSDRFIPWLHRILTNECYAEARRSQRRSAKIRLLPMPDRSSVDGTGAVDDREELERSLLRLTLEQRAVVVFHYYLDLPLSEVADRLGIPVGTVKSRLYHAIEAMRAGLEAEARSTTISKERLA
jgi:RNA polymerase sigma-70 factor (ECF subfamily)